MERPTPRHPFLVRVFLLLQYLVSGVLASLASPGLAAAAPYRSALLYDIGPAASPGGAPFAIAAGDLDEDGRPDLVVANSGSAAGSGFGNTVSVLRRSLYASLPPHFRPRTNFETDFGPEGVAIADLNGDGHLDVVTANTGFGSGTVSVLYGDGSGGMSVHIDYAAGSVRGPITVADVNSDGWSDVVVGLSGASFAVLKNDTVGGLLAPTPFLNGAAELRGLTAGDVTGDGLVDIVTANGGSHSVSVLRGDGAGNFALVGVFATGAFPWSVAIGRLDPDAWPDLAVAARGSGAISILLGAGGGAFPGFVNYSVGQSAPWTLALADLQGDGVLDIMAACNEGTQTSVNTLSYLKGSGAGTFGSAVTYDGGPNPGQVVIADFDDDARPDVVVPTRGDPFVNGGTHTVALLLNDGTGSMISARHQPSAPGSYFPIVADFNCDGKLDAAVTVTNGVQVHMGNGDGSFFSVMGPPFPPSPGVLQAGDINQDGKPDLMVQSGSDIYFCEGLGAAFAAPVLKATGYTLLPGSLADLNRDTRLDLVAVDGGGQVRILVQSTLGSFIPTGTGSPAGGVLAFANADWNRDGKPDVAAATSGGVSVFLGNGDGTLGAPATLGTGSVYVGLSGGDFDRDGRPDLAARESIPSIEVGIGGVDLFRGDGFGGFGPALPYATLDRVGPLVESHDVNRDGFSDLLVSSSGTGDPPSGEPTSIGVFLGSDGATFSQHTNYAVGAADLSGFLALGDLNGDRATDVVGFGGDLVPGPSVDSYLSVLLANPDPQIASLESQVVYSMGVDPTRVALGDLNRDGKIDVVASSSADGGVTVRLGTGAGDLEPPQPLPQSLATRQIGLGDFNRDGILDLATIGGSSPTRASIMTGVGDGTFGPRVDFDAATNASELEIEDVNRDGKADLILFDDGGSIRVHPGVGNGTFGPVISTPGGAGDMDLADLNCDGKLDIVGATGSAVIVQEGLGNGAFGPATPYFIGSGIGTSLVCVADFNKDGKQDVAAPSVGAIPAYMAVLLGNGSGGFITQVNTTIVSSPSEIAVGYAEADADPFLYTSESAGNQLVIFKSLGNGMLFPGTFHPTAAGPLGIALGDLNRDGLPDVVVANAGSDNVSVLLHGEHVVSAAAPTAEGVPQRARLAQNYPNPFNPRTTIRFELVRPGRARLSVFDVRGRRVATLVDGYLQAGEHRRIWDGRNETGAEVAAGVYFYRLTTSGGEDVSRRMVIVK